MRKTKAIILFSLIILFANSYVNAYKRSQEEKLRIAYRDNCPNPTNIKHMLNKIAYVEISPSSNPDIIIDAKKYCYINNHGELQEKLHQDINNILQAKYG
jgi:hypothetical protein